MGIAAAIAATSNRGGTLGLRTRAPGDYAIHCTGAYSRLLHRRRPGGGAGSVRPAGGGGAHRAAGSLAWRQLLHEPSPRWGARDLSLVWQGLPRPRRCGSAAVSHRLRRCGAAAGQAAAGSALAGALALVGHSRRREPLSATGSASVDHPPPAGPPAGGEAPWRKQRGNAVRPPADRRCLPPPRRANPARGDGSAGNIPALLLYPAARGQRSRLEDVIASEDMRQLLAMEARCRRYMWVPGPITTVHYELNYRG